jgi:hypothetical protein
LVATLAVACAEPGLRGANSVDRGDEPRTTRRDRLVPSACHDADGKPAAAPALFVVRGELPDGREIVLEERLGYDAVVIGNAYFDGSTRVYEYVADAKGAGAVLHTLRFPVRLDAAELEDSDTFELQESGNTFRGVARKVALSCQLVPWASSVARASATR